MFRRFFFRCAFSSALVFLCLFSLNSPVFSHEVIVHTGVKDVLSKNTLRSIYSMKLKTWGDGTGITVFVLDPFGESHRDFSLEVLNIFPYQLQRVWDVLVFSGTGDSPIIVKNEQEMIDRVTATAGAIGYINKQEVSKDVRKINIK